MSCDVGIGRLEYDMKLACSYGNHCRNMIREGFRFAQTLPYSRARESDELIHDRNATHFAGEGLQTLPYEKNAVRGGLRKGDPELPLPNSLVKFH